MAKTTTEAQTNQNASTNSETMAKTTTEALPASHYEDWRVEVKNGKEEKIKMLRPKVKISEEHANILNEGALGQGNANYAIMYFTKENS